MPHTTDPVETQQQGAKIRRRDAKGTRERLVRAALELFTSQGYHASTTPQVARKAGVAEGTIYRHFTSKAQLLNEIYRGAVHTFIKSVKDASKTAPCRQQLTEVARRWGEIATDDPALVKLVFVAPPSPLLDDQSLSLHETMRAELEKVVASGKASGEIRPGPAYLWTDVWFQLVGLMLERVAAGTWSAQHSAPQQVIDSAWDAVAAQPRNAPSAPQPSPAGVPAGP